VLSKRKRRVRLHLIDPNPHFHLPSVEGILVSRRGGEYAVAVAELVTDAAANNVQLDSKLLIVPAGNVAFYEVL
jgi:hypothetical protein